MRRNCKSARTQTGEHFRILFLSKLRSYRLFDGWMLPYSGHSVPNYCRSAAARQSDRCLVQAIPAARRRTAGSKKAASPGKLPLCCLKWAAAHLDSGPARPVMRCLQDLAIAMAMAMDKVRAWAGARDVA